MSSERKPPDDSELDDFLAGKHPVGRAYREVSEHETAPRELDDAILRMAREHAAPKSDAVAPRRLPRWVQPLALAATLALSLSVLINIWREPALRQQTVPMEQGGEEAMAPASPAAAPKPRVTVDPSSGQAERRAEPFPNASAKEAVRERDPSLSDSNAAPASSPPPPPVPAAPTAGAAASRPDVDPSLLEREDPRFSFHSLLPKDEVASPAPVQEKKRQPIRSEDVGGLAKEERSVQKSMASEAAAPVEAQRAAEDDGEALDVLIERARAAVARGDDDEARRVVAELRRRHPDAPLPEDLRPFDIPAR